MKEVFEFLKACGTFYLATTEGDQPRVRPFGAVSEIDGRLYLITSNQKDVFKQLKGNPKVELCCTNENGEWLRVTARLTRDTRREAKEKMLADNPGLQSLYAVDDGIMEVLYLEDATATFSTFSKAPRTVTF